MFQQQAEQRKIGLQRDQLATWPVRGTAARMQRQQLALAVRGGGSGGDSGGGKARRRAVLCDLAACAASRIVT